jgi:hypothetical protein
MLTPHDLQHLTDIAITAAKQAGVFIYERLLGPGTIPRRFQ